jgi:hypothetical protein
MAPAEVPLMIANGFGALFGSSAAIAFRTPT